MIMESKDVKACNYNVVASVASLSSVDGGVYVGDQQVSSMTEQAYYKGKVLNFGPKATETESEQCPELASLKEEDYIIFSDFSGYHVPTVDNFCKVIRGHDIVGITTDPNNMNTSNVKPTGNRILVEVIREDAVKDGVYNTTIDPRSKDIQLGRVVSCAENADQYTTGTIVGFEPHVGNPLVNSSDLFLKTINSLDIEFILAE